MKKTMSILRKTLVWAVAILVAATVIFTVVFTFVVEKEEKDIIGFKMFAVLSDSMSDTFKTGDIIVCKEIDPSQLQAGDIITFKSTNPDSYGLVITHKIRERIVTDKNQDAFITYGTAVDKNDEKPVLFNKIVGKYQFKISGAGRFFEFLKTPQGYILFILLPFAALISVQIISTIRLLKKRKKEREEQIADKKESLDAERAQTAALLEEIKTLREQLNKSGENKNNPDVDGC